MFTHHNHQNVLRRLGVKVQSPHCHQHATARIQLEEAGTSRVLAAVDGIDEAFAIVLICGLDSEEFNPRQCVLRDPDLIVILQELRPVVVDVSNHKDVDLNRGTGDEEADCGLHRHRAGACWDFTVPSMLAVSGKQPPFYSVNSY